MVHAVPFLLFILIPLLFALYLIVNLRRPSKYPPGPRWLPIIGNMRDIKKLAILLGGQHLALSQLAKNFNTNILGLKIGGDLTIVVSSYKTVRNVLIGDEFEGRPNNFFIRLRCMGTRRGITCVDGPLWTEQRNFVVRHLRNIGYGKKPMEMMVHAEVVNLLQLLDKKRNEVIQLGPIFAPSVLNVLWTLATGSRLSRDDPRLSNFLGVLHMRSKAFDMAGGTMSQLPWLRHIIPEQIGYNLLVRLNQQLRDFFIETIEQHHKTWYPGREDDLIYSFISEMRENPQSSNFTDDQLIMICLDLFIAGATTTSTTLDFTFLEMVLHPEIQEKAAQLLLTTTDSNESLNYSDRLKVPYIEAIIMEVERFHGVTPIIGPRRVLQNTQLEQYVIPKETTVLINIHSVHFDEEYWGDPYVFRPERFINKEGKLISSERVLNFGLGKRRCLGELLARQCIFLFFASILRKYKICREPGADPPSPVPLPGLTLSPQPYNVQLQLR